MATKMTPLQERQRDEYFSRINRVIDYIEQHLTEELPLEKLARVASFSAFHFHRIFSAMVGETLTQFILRLRIEKAASQLLESPKKSVTEIAYDYGFSSSATFARAFKNFYGMNASQWRAGGYLQDSKNRKTNRKNRKDFHDSPPYDDVSVSNNKSESHSSWSMKMNQVAPIQVEVKELSELHVAYVRHIGPYSGDEKLFEGLFGKLMKWGGARGLLESPDSKTLVIYHDDPELTEEDKLRISVCLTVPEGTEVDGEIGKMVVPGGKFAVARFEINGDEFEGAWNSLMGDWLPQSGYQPDDRLCYELYHENTKEGSEKKYIIDICEPIRPL